MKNCDRSGAFFKLKLYSLCAFNDIISSEVRGICPRRLRIAAIVLGRKIRLSPFNGFNLYFRPQANGNYVCANLLRYCYINWLSLTELIFVSVRFVPGVL